MQRAKATSIQSTTHSKMKLLLGQLRAWKCSICKRKRHFQAARRAGATDGESARLTCPDNTSRENSPTREARKHIHEYLDEAINSVSAGQKGISASLERVRLLR
jgi:hypothetical protein